LAACGRDPADLEPPNAQLRILPLEDCAADQTFDTSQFVAPVLELVVQNLGTAPIKELRFEATLECAAMFWDRDPPPFPHGEYAHFCGVRMMGLASGPSIPPGAFDTIRAPVFSEGLVRALDAVLPQTTDGVFAPAVPLRVDLMLEAMLEDGAIVRSERHFQTVHFCRGCSTRWCETFEL
jgi:hypothetical protein